MDITKQYILMCEKAEEIQYSHKPQTGDSYLCDCSSCKFPPKINLIESFDMDNFNKRDLTNVEPPYIWLPRQDQLQEMLSRNLSYLIAYFADWWSNLHKASYDSMEQLWLAFVMKEQYSKQWTGTDWEVIK